ncbi:MAG: CoA transferase [Rhodocyclaceae bacterium]|nr:CoA transferase [Rhodocyclaceae bacterium]
MRDGPLAGLRVLDLTRLLPGPLATQHLADSGAEVIKIEDTGAGDYARTMGAMHGDTSIFFRLVNRNKKSLRLDLKQEEGRAVLLRLAETADLVVEGFRPGVMDRLGLSHAHLAKVNPRIVLCSITGYGQSGPYADRAGHDINYIGYAGVLDQIGCAGGAPAIPNLQIGDLLGGTLSAVFGMLAAILEARTAGKGRHVDVSMAEATLAHAIFPLVTVLGEGRVRACGEDLLSGGVPCYGVYETSDGRHMAVGALEEKFWHLLCDTLGRTDLKPAHLATGDAGRAARDELAAVFRSRTQQEWVAVFDAVDCCVTPVLRLEESLENEHFVARGNIQEVDGLRQFAPPVRFSGFAPPPPEPPPHAGADSEALLRELGFDDSGIEALRARRVI